MATSEIDSATGFREAVGAAVEQALSSEARRVVFVDADFDGWPLEDSTVIDTLTQFVRLPGRRVVLFARSFDMVLRRCPRFVGWRRTWGHAIDASRPTDEADEVPTLLLVDRQHAVRLMDKDRWRGQILDADPRIQVLAQEIDAFVQRSEPTFGATTLGL